MPEFLFDSRTISAFIGAIVVLVGWFFTFYRERSARRSNRNERIRDVQRALFAEIRAYLAVLKRDHLDLYRTDMIARMRGKDGNGKAFIPLIPTERNDTIFRAIVADIHILPRSSIDPVALYYSQLAAISALIADLRSPEYREMDTERRIRMYSDYIDMKKEAIVLGDEAMLMIATYAAGGQKAVGVLKTDRLAEIPQTVEIDPNIPDEGRSDP